MAETMNGHAASLPLVDVRLLTAAGAYVATAAIPRFAGWPDVLLWGSRIFARNASGEYREAFTWTVAVIRPEADIASPAGSGPEPIAPRDTAHAVRDTTSNEEH